jgi:hypothetical protein
MLRGEETPILNEIIKDVNRIGPGRIIKLKAISLEKRRVIKSL